MDVDLVCRVYLAGFFGYVGGFDGIVEIPDASESFCQHRVELQVMITLQEVFCLSCLSFLQTGVQASSRGHAAEEAMGFCYWWFIGKGALKRPLKLRVRV